MIDDDLDSHILYHPMQELTGAEEKSMLPLMHACTPNRMNNATGAYPSEGFQHLDNQSLSQSNISIQQDPYSPQLIEQMKACLTSPTLRSFTPSSYDRVAGPHDCTPCTDLAQ